MPVKWDHDNDHTERPTPRAIRERLQRIRSTTKARIPTVDGDVKSGRGRKTAQPSTTNGVSPIRVRATPMPVTPTNKKRIGTKLVKTEEDNDVTMIKSADDADDEKDVIPITPPSDRKIANHFSPKVKPPHALGLGITASPATPHTPQSIRKKSMIPASRHPIRHNVDPETDSDEASLSGSLKGDDTKMETRGKRALVYQSDDSQPDSEVSEFGIEKD
ncbi:MAG: hypothetical protein Q9160_008923 [Pyrenula sp. 1 TL-2023]